MNPLSDDSTRVFQRATQWLSELQDGKADSAALFRWLAESPRHVEEFAFALSLTDEIAGLTDEQCTAIAAMNTARREAPTVIPFSTAEVIRDAVTSNTGEVAQSRSTESTTRRWSMGVKGLSAVAAMLLVLIGGLAWWDNGWQTYSTDFGEQKLVDLADGSVVYLNTDSRIKVKFSSQSRDIRMVSGEGLFKVEHDPAHPFRVYTGQSVIQAVGTQFNVYRHDRGTTVAVLEGSVRITPDARDRQDSLKGAGTTTSGATQNLSVGQEAQIVPNGHIVTRHIDVSQAAAWRQHRLVFNNDTLADIAIEFNRYNRRPQIRIEDASAGARRFAATFDADAPDALVRVLKDNPDLEVKRAKDEIVVRSR